MPCSTLARTHDLKNFLSSIQVFCCETFTRLCPTQKFPYVCAFWRFGDIRIFLKGAESALIRCLISLLAVVQYLISSLLMMSHVCAVLYVITFTPFFVSSPECAHLSPNTCKLLLMFLHLILCCPSPYCIPHAIIKCRMTILIC